MGCVVDHARGGSVVVICCVVEYAEEVSVNIGQQWGGLLRHRQTWPSMGVPCPLLTVLVGVVVEQSGLGIMSSLDLEQVGWGWGTVSVVSSSIRLQVSVGGLTYHCQQLEYAEGGCR